MAWITRSLGFLTSAWIVYTLYAVLRFGGAVVVDPSTTGRIMSVRSGDQIVSSIGLNYHGLAGALLVVVEVVVVMAALVGAIHAHDRRRLLARGALVAWTALWLGNALWLRSHGWRHGADTILMAVALALAVGWMLGAVKRSPSENQPRL